MVEDIYPSRCGKEPQVTDRQDPVYHGHSGDQGPLTEEQINFFIENGYLFFESFLFSEEAQKYKNEMDRLRRDSRTINSEESFLEPGSRDVRSIFNIHSNNEMFKKLACDTSISNRVTQLLGSPVYIHQSRINYKPGFKGKEFFWHSDFETWHVEDGMPRMRAISCSITLTENNEHNGPLLIVPGSHKYYLSCAGETPEDHFRTSLKKQEYGVPTPGALEMLVDQGGIFSAKGPPGSMILFDCNIMHGSNGNISPWPRSNIFFVYNSVENTLTSPFCGLSPRPNYIANRDFSNILKHRPALSHRQL